MDRSNISKTTANIYNAQEKKNIVLLQEYKKALKDVKSEVALLYEKMESGNISLSEGYKYNRLTKTKKQLEEIIKELGNTEEKFMKESLKETYINTSKEVAKELASNGINIDFNKVPKQAIENVMTTPWTGKVFSSTLWTNKDRLLDSIKSALIRGLVQGKSYKEMAKEIKKLMNSSSYNALRLIRNETAIFIREATLDRYKQSGVVNKVQWWSAKDERLCNDCGEKHGNIYDFDKVPDRHVLCRCTLLPVIDGSEGDAKEDKLKAKEEIKELKKEKSNN